MRAVRIRSAIDVRQFELGVVEQQAPEGRDEALGREQLQQPIEIHRGRQAAHFGGPLRTPVRHEPDQGDRHLPLAHACSLISAR